MLCLHTEISQKFSDFHHDILITPTMKFVFLFISICLCLLNCEEFKETIKLEKRQIPIKNLNQIVQIEPEIAFVDSMILQDFTVRHVVGFDTI